MKLIDAIYLEKSLSEESLMSDFEGIDENVNKKGKRNAVERDVIDDDDKNDLFDFTRAINKTA